MKFAKLFSIMLLGIMLVSAVSHAQSIPSGTARYEALGYNPFIKDASIDINRNPAWTTVYRNYAFGDIGRNEVNQNQLTEQFGAVNFGVSKDLALGLVLNKFEDRWNEFTIDTLYGVQRPVVPLKVTLGWQMSPNFALGLAPYYSGWSSETQPNATDLYKWSSSVFGGTVGVLGKMKSGWIEGAVDVKTHKYSYEQTVANVTNTFESNGGLSLNIFTRAFFVVNKATGINLVPYLSFGMYNWNPTITPTPTGFPADKFSYLDFNGGLGINMPVLEHGLLAGGLSVGYHQYKDKQDNSTFQQTYSEFYLPKFNFGLEWGFTDWLTGRLGYSRAVSSYKNEYQFTGVTTYNKGTNVTDPDQTITTGLGFHFDRFSLDGTVGERLYKNGIYLVSGKTNDLFGMLSASYNFGK